MHQQVAAIPIDWIRHFSVHQRGIVKSLTHSPSSDLLMAEDNER